MKITLGGPLTIELPSPAHLIVVSGQCTLQIRSYNGRRLLMERQLVYPGLSCDLREPSVLSFGDVLEGAASFELTLR